MCKVSVSVFHFFFFFFQAEDGIRDLTVTGVQTCALPIYGRYAIEHGVGAVDVPVRAAPHVAHRPVARVEDVVAHPVAVRAEARARDRSEERRVGEECRSRWAPDHLKKKKKKRGGG